MPAGPWSGITWAHSVRHRPGWFRGVVLRLGQDRKAWGGPPEEWRVLAFLGDGGGCAMTEIAEFAPLSAPTRR
ncbi:helix-turn-helix domain-containing protein [Streptomyces pseudovenezuelae]|uniref:MarR family transcriptional regulator n=1 Tax=Streptomyces pseudovenezuelae TaxID=67350 RepID=UPI002E35177B|nr:helix-turn-helix domain-containing protein [Streptomyces pseudovenezuelae]